MLRYQAVKVKNKESTRNYQRQIKLKYVKHSTNKYFCIQNILWPKVKNATFSYFNTWDKHILIISYGHFF